MKDKEKNVPSPYFHEIPKAEVKAMIQFNLTRRQMFERMQGIFMVILHLKERNPKDFLSGFKSALICLFQDEPALLDALDKDVEIFYQEILKKHYENLNKDNTQ